MLPAIPPLPNEFPDKNPQQDRVIRDTLNAMWAALSRALNGRMVVGLNADRVAVDPVPVEGVMWFETDTQFLYVSDGDAWIKVLV